MKAININGVITIYPEIPKVWHPNKHAYHLRDYTEHFADGFYDYIDVEANDYQNKSEIYLDESNSVYTHIITDKPQEEIAQIKNKKYNDLLNIVFIKVKLYARALAMNKSIDEDLDYFEFAYTNKYNMCMGLIPDPNNTLESEAILEGYNSVAEYKSYVIMAYEQGKYFRDQSIQMLEVIRKRVILDKEQDKIDNALIRLTMIDNLPFDVEISDIAGVFTDVMSVS